MFSFSQQIRRQFIYIFFSLILCSVFNKRKCWREKYKQFQSITEQRKIHEKKREKITKLQNTSEMRNISTSKTKSNKIVTLLNFVNMLNAKHLLRKHSYYFCRHQHDNTLHWNHDATLNTQKKVSVFGFKQTIQNFLHFKMENT